MADGRSNGKRQTVYRHKDLTPKARIDAALGGFPAWQRIGNRQSRPPRPVRAARPVGREWAVPSVVRYDDFMKFLPIFLKLWEEGCDRALWYALSSNGTCACEWTVPPTRLPVAKIASLVIGEQKFRTRVSRVGFLPDDRRSPGRSGAVESR